MRWSSVPSAIAIHHPPFNYMGKSPSRESDSHSASQGILRLLWNPTVHYRLHKSPKLVLILSQMNQIHAFSPCFPKIHYNIIYPSTRRSSEWSLTFMFSNQNIVCIFHLSHPYYMSRPSHPPWLDLPNNILCNVYETPRVMFHATFAGT